MGRLRNIGRLRAGGSGFSPLSLFAAGEQGGWYDPSDLSTMFQDSVGTTPVTATTQPVGLILDKRLGLTRGATLLTNGDFSGGTTGWAATGSGTFSVTGGVATIGATAANTGAIQLATGAVANVVYAIPIVVTSITGTLRAMFNGGVANTFSSAITTPGAFTLYVNIPASATPNGGFSLVMLNAGETCNVDSVSVQAVSGNQLNQATGGSRPLEQTQGGFLATKSDGLDDFLATVAGGGGTAGFFYCAAINPSAIGANQTLWADTGTNTGYRVRLNATNQLELAAGNNVAFTTAATVATVTTGTTYVVMAWHDGVNLSVQINSNTVASTAFGTTTAGTAAFTDAASNGGASGFFNGYLFNRVYKKDSGLTSAQRTKVQQFIANGAGVTL